MRLSEPLTLKDIKNICPEVDQKVLDKIVEELNEFYSTHHRAFHIMPLANGLQMVTREEYSIDLRKLYDHRVQSRLSKPALETLAIIAYKQPVTKSEVEDVRGVNADNMFKTLLNRELVKITGRKEVPGRPIIYETTDKFLQYFGLSKIGDLPKYEDVAQLIDEETSKGDSNEHGNITSKDQHNRLEDSQIIESEITTC